jgi:hypothetical protein
MLAGEVVKNCLSAASFFNVPTTARSARYPPKVDVKDGCPFLAPSFRQVKEGETNKLIPFIYYPEETGDSLQNLTKKSRIFLLFFLKDLLPKPGFHCS